VIKVPKNITLHLSDEAYQRFHKIAAGENRSISNLIETLATQKLTEELFTDTFETEEILSNKILRRKLKNGHRDITLKKGRFVG
jgi:predicted CopG family antitoxin